MVPEMQARYQDVRKGHLAIYQDTLDQIRGENAFAELQKRAEKLVGDCVTLNRLNEQKVPSICGLYNGAEAVSTRYDALMASIASKTATKFHPTPRKGLLRICEKLALASEWKPERVLDITRGLCPDTLIYLHAISSQTNSSHLNFLTNAAPAHHPEQSNARASP